MSAAELIGRLREAPALGGIARGSRGRSRAATRARRRGVVGGLVAMLVAAALFGGFLWLRGSSLVAVQRVRVVGVSGPDAGPIRAALTVAARGMTTLDVRMRTLRAAVAPYPVVAGVRATPHVPHGLTITVAERLPVAAATVNSARVAVAADGVILRDMPTASLPAITLRVAPGGPRVTEPTARQALALLGAAPRAILGAVTSVAPDPSAGLVATLRHGPSIRFGDASQAAAKWQAALVLLATPQDAGAVYLDVTDPHRPAAGIGAAAAAAAGVSLASGTLGATSSGGGALASTTGATGTVSTTSTPSAASTTPSAASSTPSSASPASASGGTSVSPAAQSIGPSSTAPGAVSAPTAAPASGG